MLTLSRHLPAMLSKHQMLLGAYSGDICLECPFSMPPNLTLQVKARQDLAFHWGHSGKLKADKERESTCCVKLNESARNKSACNTTVNKRKSINKSTTKQFRQILKLAEQRL